MTTENIIFRRLLKPYLNNGLMTEEAIKQFYLTPRQLDIITLQNEPMNYLFMQLSYVDLPITPYKKFMDLLSTRHTKHFFHIHNLIYNRRRLFIMKDLPDAQEYQIVLVDHPSFINEK